MPFDKMRASFALRDRRDLPAPTKAVMGLSIILRSNEHAKCWPSYECIAGDAGVSRRTAIRAVLDLERLGLVRIEARHDGAGDRAPNIFTVTMDVVVTEGHHPVTDDHHVVPGGHHGDAAESLPVVSVDHQGGDRESPKARQGSKTGEARQGRARERASAPTLPGMDSPKTETASKRATRIPTDWQPSAETIAWCREQSVDASRVLPSFVDYWRGVAGAKGLKLDWDATLRNWIRRDLERGTAPTLTKLVPVLASPHQGPPVERTAEELAECARAGDELLGLLKNFGHGGAPTAAKPLTKAEQMSQLAELDAIMSPKIVRGT